MALFDPKKILLRDLELLNSMFLSFPFDLMEFDPAVLRMVVAKAEAESCPPSEAVRLLLNELAGRDGSESAPEEPGEPSFDGPISGLLPRIAAPSGKRLIGPRPGGIPELGPEEVWG